MTIVSNMINYYSLIEQIHVSVINVHEYRSLVRVDIVQLILLSTFDRFLSSEPIFFNVIVDFLISCNQVRNNDESNDINK
jgi:hypothetical protein